MKSGQDFCYEQVLMNMNEQDTNEWTGGCCCDDGYLCYELFLVVFTLKQFSGKGSSYSKGAMIVSLFFTVNKWDCSGRK